MQLQTDRVQRICLDSVILELKNWGGALQGEGKT